MLNTVPRITKKVMIVELEASNSGWPMGTAEPRQGINVACTYIDLEFI
jgi:hypothetical protein